jgi:hypothetical protein
MQLRQTTIQKEFDIMNEQQPSAVFGMNFLQEMKGVPAEITGAYAPEQEIWLMQGQVHSGLPKGKFGNLAGSELPSPRMTTTRSTRDWTANRTHDGPNVDTAEDTERDEERD